MAIQNRRCLRKKKLNKQGKVPAKWKRNQMTTVIKGLIVYEVQLNSSHSYSSKPGSSPEVATVVALSIVYSCCFFVFNFLVGTSKHLAKYLLFQLSLEILLPQPPKPWGFTCKLSGCVSQPSLMGLQIPCTLARCSPPALGLLRAGF